MQSGPRPGHTIFNAELYFFPKLFSWNCPCELWQRKKNVKVRNKTLYVTKPPCGHCTAQTLSSFSPLFSPSFPPSWLMRNIGTWVFVCLLLWPIVVVVVVVIAFLFTSRGSVGKARSLLPSRYYCTLYSIQYLFLWCKNGVFFRLVSNAVRGITHTGWRRSCNHTVTSVF